MTPTTTRLTQMLEETPYASYTYSYPHKTAYRPLTPPISLREAWEDERRESLFLYLHIPFCEMRCGFCNLFTIANPRDDADSAYLDALTRQARRVRAAIGPARFAHLAIGGGTPTYLSPAALARLFDLAEEVFGVDPRAIPVSVETSPHTAEPGRLRLLYERGVDRISIGVQSFIESEAHAVGRPQRSADVERALEHIRATGFPTLNIDLIYGLPDQTVESWLRSVRAALRYRPEELYLYPLYVRPLTGIGRHPRAWDDVRLSCYRAARTLLRTEGYTQVSMRMFRAAHAPAQDGPVYCCQEDGMVGLGCGARSYTRMLHYSCEYAVGRAGIRAILADYMARPAEAFDVADYGIRLSSAEQQRRYVAQSILQAEGLLFDAYHARFGSRPFDDVPELTELADHGLAEQSDEGLRLTEAGLERSDTIGPWLYSPEIRRLMGNYELR